LRDKYQRMVVAGAGIMVELFVAALAMIGWVYSQPGTFHVLCYNIFLVTGLSTLLMNGNPLQRYDGYYLLCDLIEIPSLGMRSSQYVSYLFRRYAMGDVNARRPSVTVRERNWFIGYGIASSFYRIFLVLSISFFVAQSYPLIGSGLALWSLSGYLWGPIGGLFKIMAGDQKNMPRKQALSRIGMIVLGIFAVLALPLPHYQIADGVVWLPDESNVRAQTSGDIVSMLVRPGEQVAAGDPVIVLENREAQARLVRARAEVNELEAMRTSQVGSGRVVAANKADDRIVAARQRLIELEKDTANLVVRSPATGTILFEDYNALSGRFLAKGQAPAAIWRGETVIRVLVPSEDIDRLRNQVRDVEIRPGYDAHTVMAGKVVRLVPSPVDHPPSLILSAEGGGTLAVTGAGREGQSKDNSVDIVSSTGATLAVPMFEVDVQTLVPLPTTFLNGRASVRFDLGFEPTGLRILRWVRVTFLKELHV